MCELQALLLMRFIKLHHGYCKYLAVVIFSGAEFGCSDWWDNHHSAASGECAWLLFIQSSRCFMTSKSRFLSPVFLLFHSVLKTQIRTAKQVEGSDKWHHRRGWQAMCSTTVSPLAWRIPNLWCLMELYYTADGFVDFKKEGSSRVKAIWSWLKPSLKASNSLERWESEERMDWALLCLKHEDSRDGAVFKLQKEPVGWGLSALWMHLSQTLLDHEILNWWGDYDMYINCLAKK